MESPVYKLDGLQEEATQGNMLDCGRISSHDSL
jgi:hypothetical protein